LKVPQAMNAEKFAKNERGWIYVRNGFMPHIMGHKLAHIYAREVRWCFNFYSWYSSKICSGQSKKIGSISPRNFWL